MAGQHSQAPAKSSVALLAPLPLERAGPWFACLVAQVDQLHRSSRMHAAIIESNITLDSQGLPVLSSPASHAFLETGAVPETCPPELQGRTSWDVPTDLALASAALAKAGVLIDPRRIDVFQLGALLCRLLTGQPLGTYLRSPKSRALVPASLRPVVDRALGYDAGQRLPDCEQLVAAMEQAANLNPGPRNETPALGLSHPPSAETPPRPDSPSAADNKSQPAAERLPNQLGAYQILKRIGRGGMGDVYKAYDKTLDRIVAVKVLPLELARHPDFVRRFRAEAMAVAKLTHPNIVQIFACGEDHGRHFFAMQFVNGESLAQLLKRRKSLPVAEALSIVKQCLAGLAAAHRRDLIHRDIKPGNILLDYDHRRALVADFGLVKTPDGGEKLTATGVIMGTVDYIPPEQARGLNVDARSDLYSVGALLYRMLSGRLPFISDSPTGMIFQHAFEQPTPLTDVAPDVPAPIAALVMRLLAKNPEHRYQSAEEVLAEIQAFRTGKPPMSRPASGDESKSQVILEPKSQLIVPPVFAALEPLPSLPPDPAALGVAGWRGKIWGLFHAHAPEIAKNLLDTQQQMDGAVLEYERRRNRLAELVLQATAVAADFAAQAASQRDAAAAAARRAETATNREIAAQAQREQLDGQRIADDFARQAAEQQDQLEVIRLWLAQVDATLQQMRSQRAVLQGRLRMAEAQLRRPATDRSPFRRPMVWLATAGVVLLSGAIAIRFIRQASTIMPWNTSRNPAPVVAPLPVVTAPPKPVVTAPSGASLVGRATVKGQDIGLLVKYSTGKRLLGARIEQYILEQGHATRGIKISLQGTLHLPKDMRVGVWHRGGTPSGGVHTLYVDNREIGAVGDDRTKDTAYSLFLAKGDHQVRWLLTGGQLGDNNFLEFFDPETRQPLQVVAESDAVAAVQGQPTLVEMDNRASKRETEFPQLPEPVLPVKPGAIPAARTPQKP